MRWRGTKRGKGARERHSRQEKQEGGEVLQPHGEFRGRATPSAASMNTPKGGHWTNSANVLLGGGA